MKTTNLLKTVGVVLMVVAAVAAASPVYTRAGDIEIKCGGKDIIHPAVSLFAPAKIEAVKGTCMRCQTEMTATTTQEAKLKTRTVLVPTHLCTSCKTTLETVGPKAFRTTVVKHTCGAGDMAMASCCGN